MSKIMLVEDDNNLREIYGERLMAEGYTIVSASDGEEALALAVKEKPDLIISDVMMPKISGFDMLDILRQTPETKNTKVIMMTALSQNDDKERATRLGADKYLVKSQVTLEDVARVVHDMLNEDEPAPNFPLEQPVAAAPTPVAEVPMPVATMPIQEPAAVSQPVIPVEPLAVESQPLPEPTPPAAPVVETQSQDSAQQLQSEISSQLSQFEQTPQQPVQDSSIPPIIDTSAAANAEERKVINPITDTTTPSVPNINDLYEKELAKEAALAQGFTPQPETPSILNQLETVESVANAEANGMPEIEGLSFDASPAEPQQPPVEPQITPIEITEAPRDPNSPTNYPQQ
jgi:CheY-like chemotaxis protein